MSHVKTYVHPHPRLTLLPFLRQFFLPAALPVVRRLQFHYTSTDAVAIATFPPDIEAAGESHEPAVRLARTADGRQGQDAWDTRTARAQNAEEVPASEAAQHPASPPYPPNPTPPLAVLLLDRSRAPETEAWLFSSLETLFLPDTSQQVPRELARTARAQILALVAAAGDIPLPSTFPSHADPGLLKLGAVHEISLALLLGWEGGETGELRGRWKTGVAVASAPGEREGRERNGEEREENVGDGKAMEQNEEGSMKGTEQNEEEESEPKKGTYLHASESAPAPAANEGGGVVLSYTLPYVKFLIPPPLTMPTDEAAESPLPGLVWDQARGGDYPLVIGRTHIPRTPRTLALMPSAVLRIAGRASDAMSAEASSGAMSVQPSSGAVTNNGAARQAKAQQIWSPESAATTYRTTPGRPIGWAFLSPDASLATLHVEEDYRGRGLGKMLARRVMGLLGPHGAERGKRRRDGEGGGLAGREGSDRMALGEDPRSNGDATTGVGSIQPRLHDPRAGFPLHTRREEAWMHVDVARDNHASVAVVKSLGGKEGWENFWVVVSLERGRYVLELERGEGTSV